MATRWPALLTGLSAAAGAVVMAMAWRAPPGLVLALSAIVTILGYCTAMRLFARPAPRDAPSPAPPPPADDRLSVEQLPDPAMLLDAAWTVRAANAPARELFGERVVGRDLRLTVRAPQVLDAVQAAMAGEASLREVAGLGRADGLFRLRAAAGPDGRVLLLFTDNTAARLAERMRADFVANASHELRTPLATISGFIETLLGPAADDAAARKRFLDIMAREAARMARLIDDLLSLSRIELDKFVRPQGVVDLAPLVRDVERTLAMRLEADGRRLVMEVPLNLPPLAADRDQVLQVLHNLLSNALKYGRGGTPITVGGRVVEGRVPAVRVSVRDEGDGVAPEHLPRLTERFYRVDTSRSRSMGGTGLGLAIVKHIVERHRGQLDITSRLGVGTEVSFTLPVAAGASIGADAVMKAQQ